MPFSYFAGIVMTFACVAIFAATLSVFVLIVAFGRLSPGETGQDAFFAWQEIGRPGIPELCSLSPKPLSPKPPKPETAPRICTPQPVLLSLHQCWCG